MGIMGGGNDFREVVFSFIGKPSHDLISLRWGSTKQIRALSNVLLELSGLVIFTNEECQKLFTQVNPQIIMFFL